MSCRHILAIGLMISAAPGLAQIQPQSVGGDPHLQQVDYDARQIIQLRGAPGYQMMLELSPDEEVENVALGDSAAWQVSVNKEGDRLFIKPVQPDGSTNMTVVTSVRVYNFDLATLPGPSPDMPYTVRFRYPDPAPAMEDGQYVDVAALRRQISRYRVSGDRLLRPIKMTDDGQRTYVVWPAGVAIPAVYAPDRNGREVLVNGMMGTDDVYVIEGVPGTLMFRIDSNVARASRIRSRKAR